MLIESVAPRNCGTPTGSGASYAATIPCPIAGRRVVVIRVAGKHNSRRA